MLTKAIIWLRRLFMGVSQYYVVTEAGRLELADYPEVMPITIAQSGNDDFLAHMPEWIALTYARAACECGYLDTYNSVTEKNLSSLVFVKMAQRKGWIRPANKTEVTLYSLRGHG